MLRNARDSWISVAEGCYVDGGLTVVVEFVVTGALGSNSTLIKPDLGEDRRPEAVLHYEASVQTFAFDEDHDLCCAAVDMHAVQTTGTSTQQNLFIIKI